MYLFPVCPELVVVVVPFVVAVVLVVAAAGGLSAFLRLLVLQYPSM